MKPDLMLEPLPPGKLPAWLLKKVLPRSAADPNVLVGPGLGRDAAALAVGDRVVVAKNDPITFASEGAAWHLVEVNANDVACMGAKPAWFMATALLPEGGPDDLPLRIFDQIVNAATALDIELVGGHTEVTLGLDRPIVVGAMLGEAARADIVTGDGIVPGDAVVLIGSAGIEGTALLAREAAGALTAAGVSDGHISRAAGFLRDPGISIVAAARNLCATAAPRYMHDPTEGGVATALHEMAAVAGMTIRIDHAAIPVRAETRLLCDALALDPLGLLASGALLAVIPAHRAREVVSGDNPSMSRVIGTVVAGPPGVILLDATPLPSFDRDEIARFFDSLDGGH